MRQVWIVDNDDEMSQAVGLMLELLACDVMAFLNARSAAQRLLAGARPDLMILDVHMAEVSGLDLLEFMRRRQEWKALPVLMLSSDASESTVERALQLGADGYLVKPVTIEELEKAMEAAIRKRVDIK